MKCDWLLNHSQTNESNHKNQFFRVDSFHWFIYWYGKFLAGCLNNWYINRYGNCQFWRLCTPCSWGVQVWMNKIVELVLPMIGQVYVPWIIHGNTSRLTYLLNNIPFSFPLQLILFIACTCHFYPVNGGRSMNQLVWKAGPAIYCYLSCWWTCRAGRWEGEGWDHPSPGPGHPSRMPALGRWGLAASSGFGTFQKWPVG